MKPTSACHETNAVCMQAACRAHSADQRSGSKAPEHTKWKSKNWSTAAGCSQVAHGYTSSAYTSTTCHMRAPHPRPLGPSRRAPQAHATVRRLPLPLPTRQPRAWQRAYLAQRIMQRSASGRPAGCPPALGRHATYARPSRGGPGSGRRAAGCVRRGGRARRPHERQHALQVLHAERLADELLDAHLAPLVVHDLPRSQSADQQSPADSYAFCNTASCLKTVGETAQPPTTAAEGSRHMTQLPAPVRAPRCLGDPKARCAARRPLVTLHRMRCGRACSVLADNATMRGRTCGGYLAWIWRDASKPSMICTGKSPP